MIKVSASFDYVRDYFGWGVKILDSLELNRKVFTKVYTSSTISIGITNPNKLEFYYNHEFGIIGFKILSTGVTCNLVGYR